MSDIPWPSWIKKEQNAPEQDGLFTSLKAQFDALPPAVGALTTFALGSATTISAVMMYKRYGRRIRNSDWITPKLLTRRRWLRGVATSVGDADNFRFFHTPALGGYTWPLKLRSIPSLSKDLKGETIHIRIAGVDAPEAAHFGKPAQPHAAESLDWLRGQILGKRLYCQFLRRDQYSRVVRLEWARMVHLAPRVLPGFLFYGKNISAEMLKAGWGVTYEQSGAEYGKLGKDKFLRLEAEAKAARRGMWKDGNKIETPSQYKRRHGAGATLEEAEAAKPRSGQLAIKKGWLRSLFSR